MRRFRLDGVFVRLVLTLPEAPTTVSGYTAWAVRYRRGWERHDDNEEQSLRNFDRVLRLVTPGTPTESILLMNPLVEEAGGSHWHAGGKHWTSQEAPEWQVLARWVRGETGRNAGE